MPYAICVASLTLPQRGALLKCFGEFDACVRDKCEEIFQGQRRLLRLPVAERGEYDNAREIIVAALDPFYWLPALSAYRPPFDVVHGLAFPISAAVRRSRSASMASAIL